MYKGDFHIHTTCSDGEHSPEEIVMMAKEKGLNIISITDHNNMDALEMVKDFAQNLGIEIIPGVEVSSRYKGEKIHVLGYFKNEDYKNSEFQQCLKSIREHDLERLEKILDKHLTVKRDYMKNRISVLTAIEILRFFGAKAILAHPIKIKKEIRDEVLKFNFDGIEGKYFKNTEEETNEFIKYCESKSIIYTAGSDFHTEKKEDKRHGKIGDVYLDHEEVLKLIDKLNN